MSQPRFAVSVSILLSVAAILRNMERGAAMLRAVHMPTAFLFPLVYNKNEMENGKSFFFKIFYRIFTKN